MWEEEENNNFKLDKIAIYVVGGPYISTEDFRIYLTLLNIQDVSTQTNLYQSSSASNPTDDEILLDVINHNYGDTSNAFIVNINNDKVYIDSQEYEFSVKCSAYCFKGASQGGLATSYPIACQITPSATSITKTILTDSNYEYSINVRFYFTQI